MVLPGKRPGQFSASGVRLPSDAGATGETFLDACPGGRYGQEGGGGNMATGKVKWFDPKKGYGFITPKEGGKDIFVHVTGLSKGTQIKEGDRVEYDEVEGKKGPQADQVTLI